MTITRLPYFGWVGEKGEDLLPGSTPKPANISIGRGIGFWVTLARSISHFCLLTFRTIEKRLSLHEEHPSRGRQPSKTPRCHGSWDPMCWKQPERGNAMRTTVRSGRLGNPRPDKANHSSEAPPGMESQQSEWAKKEPRRLASGGLAVRQLLSPGAR